MRQCAKDAETGCYSAPVRSNGSSDSRPQVHFKVAGREHGRRAREGRTARRRLEARKEFVEGEGLDKIVVAARAKPLDTVVDAGQVGEKQDRGRETPPNGGGRRQKPVNPRQHAIKDDDVERFGGRRLKSLASVCGDPTRVSAGLQPLRNELGSLGIVLDDQNFHARFVSGMSALIPTQSNGESSDPPRGLATQPFRVKQ